MKNVKMGAENPYLLETYVEIVIPRGGNVDLKESQISFVRVGAVKKLFENTHLDIIRVCC